MIDHPHRNAEAARHVATIVALVATLLLSGVSLGEVTVLHSGPAGLDLNVTVDVDTETVWSDGRRYTRLSVEDWPLTGAPGDPAIPYLVVPLIAPARGDIRAMVVSREDTSAILGAVLPAVEDVMISGDPNGSFGTPAEPNDGLADLPRGVVSAQIVGISGDVRIARLIVRPVSATGDHVRWAKNLQIAIRFTDQSATAGRAARGISSTTADHPASFALNSDQLGAFRLPRSESSAMRTARNAAELPEILTHRRLMLGIIHEGIYRVTLDDLEEWTDGSDIDFAGVDPNTLRLFHRGKEVPLWVSGLNPRVLDETTTIEFYARKNVGQYTDVAPDAYNDPFVDPSIYWLLWGDVPGARVAEEDGSIAHASGPSVHEARSYEQTRHFERDGAPLGVSYDVVADRNYWRAISREQGMTVAASLDAPVAESKPRLRFMGRGLSSNAHYLQVLLGGTGVLVLGSNGEFVGNDLISGESSGLSAAGLTDGDNTVNFIVGDPENLVADNILLNWFEITYERRYQTSSNYIQFRKPTEPSTGIFDFTVSGFDSRAISLYKVGVSRIVGFRTQPMAGIGTQGYEIRFQDQISGDDPMYIALTDDQKLKPFHAELLEPWTQSVKSPSRQGDYIMIAHPDLIDSAAVLADYRRSAEGGGYNVALVNAQQIYDEFAWGYPTAASLLDFVKYAYDTWSTSPRYVLLVGDATDRYDEHRLASDEAVLPVPLVPIFRWGVAGSDHPFSTMSGNDLLPELFVGRIPAADRASLSIAIDNIKEFEQHADYDEWRKTVAMVSGVGPSFTSQTDQLSDDIPDRYNVEKFYSSPSSTDFGLFEGRREEFAAFANKGALWTIFLGHAGGGIWDQYGLLVPTDAYERLTNAGRRGVYLSMTCFTGAYEAISEQLPPLCETMLFSKTGGAIAWFGATKLGWYHNDYFLAQSLVRTGVRATRSEMPLGQVIAAAKTDYVLRYGSPSAAPTSFTQALSYEFNLMGDPALRIRPPQPTLELSPSTRTPLYGDGISVEGKVGADVSGTANVVMYDYRHARLAESNDISVSAGEFTTNFTVPEEIEGTGLTLKGYLTDGESRDWTGHVRLAVVESLIDSVTLSGNSRDSIYVSAIVHDTDGILSVQCIAHIEASLPADIVAMEPFEDAHTYRTIRPLDLSGLSAADQKAVVYPWIKVKDAVGDSTLWDDLLPIYPNRTADVVVTAVDLTGTPNAALAVTLANEGEGASDSVLVRIYATALDGSRFIVGERIATKLSPKLSPSSVGGEIQIGSKAARGAESDAASTALLLPQTATVNVAIPDSLVQGQSPAALLRVTAGTRESPDTFERTPYLVPSSSGIHLPVSAEPLNLRTSAGRFSVKLESGALTATALVSIEQTVRPVGAGQPDISTPDTTALAVDWADNAEIASRDAFALTLVPDRAIGAVQSALDQERLWVGFWNDVRSQWELLETDRHVWAPGRDTVSVPVRDRGTYALLVVDDDVPPSIEVGVGGQSFSNGGFVGESSRFLLLIEDRNGVRAQPGDLRVWIDDDEMPDDSLARPTDASSATAISVALSTPPLLPRVAPYTLRVSATDAVGNSAEYEALFRVAQEEEALVTFHGNFPNPFGEDGTVLAYSLSSEWIRLVSFRIFDVAGRLVLSFDNYDQSQLYPDDDSETWQNVNGELQDSRSQIMIAQNYHEIKWLGLNRDGRPLANGVYFGIMKVRDVRGRTEEQTFKIVKTE